MSIISVFNINVYIRSAIFVIILYLLKNHIGHSIFLFILAILLFFNALIIKLGIIAEKFNCPGPYKLQDLVITKGKLNKFE